MCEARKIRDAHTKNTKPGFWDCRMQTNGENGKYPVFDFLVFTHRPFKEGRPKVVHAKCLKEANFG